MVDGYVMMKEPDNNQRSEEAELLRRKYLYRRLICRGTLRLPLKAALPLVGPDCAYHLYATSQHDDRKTT